MCTCSLFKHVNLQAVTVPSLPSVLQSTPPTSSSVFGASAVLGFLLTVLVSPHALPVANDNLTHRSLHTQENPPPKCMTNLRVLLLAFPGSPARLAMHLSQPVHPSATSSTQPSRRPNFSQKKMTDIGDSQRWNHVGHPKGRAHWVALLPRRQANPDPERRRRRRRGPPGWRSGHCPQQGGKSSTTPERRDKRPQHHERRPTTTHERKGKQGNED